MSADRAADLDLVTRSESDPETVAAWRWLFAHIEDYPPEAHVPPLARPVGPDRARRIVVADLATEIGATGEPDRFLALAVCGGESVAAVPLAGATDPAATFAGAVLSRRTRGALVAFPGAGRWTHHLILRWLAPGLCALGYRIAPIVGGSDIRALHVTKGRDSWWLCDVGAMTGEPQREDADLRAAGGREAASEPQNLIGYHRRLEAAQNWLLASLATGMRPTAGGTALAAFRRAMPAQLAKFRPPAPLVAMLRAGRGYRAGYVYARRFKGSVWQADMCRAYSWAMGEPLPLRWAFGRWEGVARDDGVWLCRIAGPGDYPAYVSLWSGSAGCFLPPRVQHVKAGVAVLCGPEMAGLRDLGYRVWPTWGYEPLWGWRADRFVAACATARRDFGAGSTQDRLSKTLANAVYGRFAVTSEGQSILYSADPPPGGYYPFVSAEGEIVDNVWVRPESVWTSSQHADLAATITARVRGRLYGAMAQLAAAGIGVYAADTDSLTVGADPSSLLGPFGEAPGDWRMVAADRPATIAGRRLMQVGGRTIAAGVTGATPIAIEAAWRGEDFEVAGRVLRLPWAAARMHATANRAVKGGPPAG